MGAGTSPSRAILPSPRTTSFSSWVGETVHRRGRLMRYARAMGWGVASGGDLVGDIDGVAIRVREAGGSCEVELHAPGVLPRLEVSPRDGSSSLIGDGLREIATGDLVFDRHYLVRAVEPWMAQAVLDADVRRALLAAPVQAWQSVDEVLLSRSPGRIEPLDVLARATALREVVMAVPWEAYDDRRTTPTPSAVRAAVAARALRPHESLPSMPRRA